MSRFYDVVVIGAGPAGIFTALELADTGASVLILEKGLDIRERIALNRDKNAPPKDRRANIVCGWGGAGAFSDGKLTLTTDYGGNLDDYMNKGELAGLISYVDSVYCRYGGADRKVYGDEFAEEIHELKRKSAAADLMFIPARIRHLGTDVNSVILANMRDSLPSNVTVMSQTAADRILADKDGTVLGVEAGGETYCCKYLVAAPGREGAEWFMKEARTLGLETQSNAVDIGVRVEVRDEVMEFLNDNLYEAKLVYHTPTFDDKVRTFCTNPSGEVATEYYDNGLAVVNGHAYKSKDLKTNNTNFAILVSKNFTKPFKTPIEYGKQIAQLSNMLCDGKILVQTFGDFRRGRRTTEERLCRNNLIPTLKDAVPGDLSLVFPHRIMVDIEEMILALDKVTPGIASDETLLYGVEVKFYSNKVVVNKDFETSVKGLRAIGDGASVTRGLQQASANGISVARSILKAMEA